MFGHPQGNLSSLFDRNYKGLNIIFSENFEIFSDSFSITISYPKMLIPLYKENLSRVGESPFQPREIREFLNFL